MKTFSTRVSMTLLLAGLLPQAAVHADLLVYEGFAYPLANNTSMHGKAATGTGAQGNWTVTNVLPSGGTASSLYQTSGLSFGSAFATSTGGALLLSTKFSGSAATTTATVQLDATATGTIWGGYLVNYSTISLAANGYSLEGIATSSAGTTINLSSRLTTDAVAANRKLAVSYDSTAAASGNTPFLTGTTYLYLSRYTNVGLPLSGSQTGVATTWVMTQAQFEAWVAGGATEATLSANATRVQSDAAVTTGTYALGPTGFVTFKATAPNFNGLQVIAKYDEIRYGTTLADVVADQPPSGTTILLR